MKLVAVTRILNEDDIVEAFIRHHAAIVDHHILLDNGSTDRTLEILNSLKAEGLKLSVLQNAAPFYNEVSYNTNLFNQARSSFGADWVLFLDADEFLDTRRAPGGLRGLINGLAKDVVCLAIPSLTYYDLPSDDLAQLIVPLRMRRRERAPPEPNLKVFVNAQLADAGATIDGGQHKVYFNGQLLVPSADHQFTLAHYYRRSPWQAISKAILGRLKVVAAGKRESDQNRSSHYNKIFEEMRDRPEQILKTEFMHEDYHWVDLVEDPLPYLGGPLRYTHEDDPKFKAIRVLVAYAEQLAAQHGLLIDTNEGIRLQTTNLAHMWRQLL